jgi:predicted dehydrogenase
MSEFVRKPRFIQARRLSPYSSRIAEGVIGDMMIHDVDLILSMVGDTEVDHVEAMASRVHSDTEDVASALVRFTNGCVASLTASRVSQQKIRAIEVTQDDMFIAADLLRQGLEINHGTEVGLIDEEGRRRFVQSSVVEIPYLDRHGEPLRLELEEFLSSIDESRTPLVSGHDGIAALELVNLIQSAAGVSALNATPV